MNILGLHLGHDASCAVIEDNRLVALIEKERLTRIKYDRGYNDTMVATALITAGLTMRDIDFVALSIPSGNRSEAAVREQDLWGIHITKGASLYRKGPRQMTPWDYEDGLQVTLLDYTLPAAQVQHHIAHCASSYYLSNWNDAVCLSYDGSGAPDNQNSAVMHGVGTELQYIECPNMNSALYFGQAAHRVLGNWRDSGKLMGLAAYGNAMEYKIDPLVELMEDTGWKEFEVMVPRRGDNHKQEVAATMQHLLMREVSLMNDKLKESFNVQNLCLSGGGALNIYGNSHFMQDWDVFCAPFCKDSGLSAGAALYVLHHIYGEGLEEYTTQDITFLGMVPPPNGSISDDVISETAELLAQNKVVLWHQGRSEAGPRALSHRSIFALPHIHDNRKRVSQQLKGREWYRPLAPIVPADDASKYFDIEPSRMSELMLVNAQVKDESLTEVTHHDGTARVQTITEEFNPEVYKLLKQVGEATGYPVLINTSLNILGTAINETAQDTLWTLNRAEVECVAMVDGVLVK